MYIETVPNRGSRATVLLREGRRQGKKVVKRTLANLTEWPRERVEALRAVLKGGTAVESVEGSFEVVRSRAHGHVAAVLGTVRRVGLERMLRGQWCRERDLVVAMVVARIIEPCSKLATARGLKSETGSSTLGEMLGVEWADEDALYGALDWLVRRQGRIEQALASRHLNEGVLVLYDVTSTYFEGRTCPLARYGHSRDGKKDKIQIVFGLLCTVEGVPVAVEVFDGNTADCTTLTQQVSNYKSLSAVERAFRTIKTVELNLRPIHHRLPDRVRAHVFLCMLGYYVEWHMRKALAPLLFDEEDDEGARAMRQSVVAPAQRSAKALRKARTKRTEEGLPVHSFTTLLRDLATIVKNRFEPTRADFSPFEKITRPTPLQQRAFDLLGIRI